MKRQKTLISALLALIVLALAIVLVKNLNLETGLDTNGDEVVTGDAVFGLESEEIEGLTWTYNGSTYSLVKEDGVWQKEGDEAFPVDQDKAEEFAAYLSSMKSDLRIDNIENMKQYGLDQPNGEIIFRTADSEYTVEIGSENTLGGSYYISFAENQAYLVDDDVLTYAKKNMNAYLKKEEIDDTSDLISIQVVRKDSTLSIDYKEEGTDAYSDQYHYFSNDLTLDNELTKNFADDAGGVTLGTVEDYDAAEHLSQYGLDDPDASVTISYVKHTEEEVDGKTEEKEEDAVLSYDIAEKDDKCYIRLSGSDIVYSLGSSAYDVIMRTTEEDLLPDTLLNLDFDQAEKVTFTLDGETFTLTSEVKGSGDDAETVWNLENETCDPDDVFSGLNSLGIVRRENDTEGVRNAILTIRITQENKKDISAVFYKYTSGSVVAEVNGERSYILSRSDITDLIEKINTLVLPEDEE